MRKKYQKVIKEACTEAITFARVSSEKQEKGVSINAQKELIYDYCVEKGLKIVKEFEITESTTRGDRVKYNQMLDFIRSRTKKTAIVVNCVDRLQRSDEDNPALNSLRKAGKIELHFMKEHIILDEDSPVHDVFSWKMNVLMAGNYTDSLSYNVKRSFQMNRSKGLLQGMAPLGYLNRHDDDNKAIVIVDPVRGPIIRRLFQEFSNGTHTLQSIWELSKELGLYSKMKKRHGKFVSKNTVYDILTNPFYYGEMCIKGEFMPHVYEPLTTREIFQRIQNLFTSNGNHNRNNTEEYAKTPYTFRGLIHCKECGCLITPEKKIKKNGREYIYLRCGHPCKECHQGIVNEQIILEQLKNEVLKKITLPPTLQEALKAQLLKDLNDTSRFNATIKTKITNQLNDLKLKEDRLLDFYLEGKLPQATYDVKKAEIDNEIKQLQENVEKYKTIDNTTKENIIKVMSTAGNILNIFEKASPSNQNKLLRTLISDCKLNGKVLEYTINKPFDRLISCSDYNKWATLTIEHLDEFECVKV